MGDPEAVPFSEGAQTYRTTVAYDGTGYSGFQIQADRPTIQGAIEKALLRITQQQVRVKGAGRTDAGVHARGQVISFACVWAHGPAVLQRALNAVLPADIVVADLVEVQAHFHARFSAFRRLYVYTVFESPWRAPLLERYAYRVRGPVQLQAMAEAANVLVGEHDFAAFGQPTVGQSTVRRVWVACWSSRPLLPKGGWLEEPGPVYQFHIEANGFLRGMVRRVVGTLLEVGSGARTAHAFGEVLASGDIAAAGPPAPPCGLCLWRVSYAPVPAEGMTCS
ncbi:MAG TPA: tRNA pseudouridine(38-40) synthase TruA [Anaerolineae bacterium]|nr:tRNA pseudouridine(38-40) synthase TruA [Anaerolineae bacterium]